MIATPDLVENFYTWGLVARVNAIHSYPRWFFFCDLIYRRAV